jgi:hypothetical protein
VAALAERVESERVTLEVQESLWIELGVILKPGAYPGTRKQSWLGGEYWIELTADELRSLGAPSVSAADKVEYDVSKFVRSGKIAVF